MLGATGFLPVATRMGGTSVTLEPLCMFFHDGTRRVGECATDTK
jgi:hypothetical protein